MCSLFVGRTEQNNGKVYVCCKIRERTGSDLSIYGIAWILLLYPTWRTSREHDKKVPVFVFLGLGSVFSYTGHMVRPGLDLHWLHWYMYLHSFTDML